MANVCCHLYVCPYIRWVTSHPRFAIHDLAMSSTLTVKSSGVSLRAEQNPRARERSRLPQERRFYQVNALPNLLLSPQQKPPEVAQIEITKHVEPPTTPPTLWKRLSAPGTFSRRSSWGSAEVLSVSKQNAAPNLEEKRQKGFGLGERIKHLLSPKQSVKGHSDHRGHPDHVFQPPTPKAEPEAEPEPEPEPEPEIQPDQRQSHVLETQIAEFGSRPFRLTPLNELALLAVSSSLPVSSHSSVSEIRPSTSLFNLTAGLNGPDSRPATAMSIPLREERMSAAQPFSDRPVLPDLGVRGSVLTTRQFESYQPESRPATPFDINASDDVLLDSIVDFFESFGVGFRWTNLEEDTFGLRSPADIDPISNSSVSRRQVVAGPA